MNCPQCGSAIAATDHFCETCGARLNAPHASPAIQAETLCLCPPGQSQPDEDGFCQICGVRCTPKPALQRALDHISVDEHFAAATDRGQRHPINEDAVHITRTASGDAILIVADGVSSSMNAERASDAAALAALHSLQEFPESCDLEEAVRVAITVANEAVLALDTSQQADGPETTIVVAFCRQQRVAIGWVGDSRAYLLTGGMLEQLTTDDSWIEEVVQSGKMSREQAMADRRAHYVTQVLGMRDQQVLIHVNTHTIPTDSLLLLCTDGLWNYFPDTIALLHEIQRAPAGDALALCRYLVDRSNEQGGRDNITVAVLQVP